jgi:hypothetical protein
MSGQPNPATWWEAPKGEAHKKTIQFVNAAEDELGDVFERLFRLEYLYDPNNPDADPRQQDRVTENAIASNVDTVEAVIASTDIRVRYLTDGADWKQQRIARRLEWYSEDLGKRYDVLPKCRLAFKESAKKGNGLVKVHSIFDTPRVDFTLLENIVVPPDECREGRDPRQMHQWDYVDADELAMRFPEHEESIRKAVTNGRRRRNNYARQLISNDVECLWSYRLPIGVRPWNYNPKKKYANYKPGRATLVLHDTTLLDMPWNKEHFPYSMTIWSNRINSFYKISAAERIMGIQRALNKNNWVIEKGNDNVVMPPIYVRPADANIGAKANRVNGYTVYRADMPVTVQHQAVPNETYNRNDKLVEKAQREFGQTSMATHGAKPAGVDSAVAMREFKDQTTQRFASQEQAFEHFILWTHYLLIDVCKDLGDKAPTVMRRSRFGSEKMRWKDVDLGDVRVQMQAAANLNRTPAGRSQLVIEFAQAGIISTDQARRLMSSLDLESELSLYTAALEDIEHSLDAIADGKVVMPEPFTNAAMGVWRSQNEYLKWQNDGAPEEILENLRQYIVQAAWIQGQAAPANQNAPQPDAAGAGALPPTAAPPGGAPPEAAFAQQAMQLQAS